MPRAQPGRMGSTSRQLFDEMMSVPNAQAGRFQGLPQPQRFWAILAVGMALTMGVTDQSIANVVLPTIAADLGIDPANSIWIVNAYQVAILVSLLPLAALGEIIGYSRIYLGGLALFTVASLACALSTSFEMSIMARVVQGLGSSGVMAVNMAILRFIYPQDQIGRGIGLNATIIAVSFAAGPTIASLILSVATWPWLFAVNIPLGLATLAVGAWALPASPRAGHSFDIVSAVLTVIIFGLWITVIDTIGHGASAIYIVPEIVVMLSAGYLLFRQQISATSPLFPVDLMRIPMFALSIGTSINSFIAQMLALVSLPFFLQGNLGYTAVQTGLLMTPWPLATALLAPISGRLSDRYPVGLLATAGLLVFAAGLATLALTPPGAGPADIAWRMALAGAGFGLYQSPNNRTIIFSASRARSGAASGMQSVARMLGQSMGAVLTAFLFGVMPQNQATIVAPALGIFFSVLAAFISVVRLTGLARAQPGRAF